MPPAPEPSRIPSAGGARTSADEERRLQRVLVEWLLHRIDAWGVAFVVCILAFWLHDALTGATFVAAIAIAVAYAIGYLLNDYFDVPFDSDDLGKSRRNVFVGFPLGRRWAMVAFVVLVAAGVGHALSTFGQRGLFLLAAGLVAMWAYSAPPLRIKSRPGLDLVWHALFVQTFAYVLCLVLIDVTWTGLDYLVIAINFLASLSGQLAQQVRDFNVDSLNTITFATVVGRAHAITLLQLVTGVLILVFVGGLVTGVLPLVLAPLAFAFAPAGLGRLRRGYSGPPPPTVVRVGASFAVVYVCVLVWGFLD